VPDKKNILKKGNRRNGKREACRPFFTTCGEARHSGGHALHAAAVGLRRRRRRRRLGSALAAGGRGLCTEGVKTNE
jgi:hypothetical protein